MRALVVIGFVTALASIARAQAPAPVALLPLDAEKRLEIYGQPVATEIARVLVANGIDVVVVKAKMAVPESARLVVDGTIKAGKGGTVTFSVRFRDPRQANIVVDTVVVSAASLDGIDPAIGELSNKVLPAIKGRLATLATEDARPAEPHKIAEPPRVDTALVLAAISISSHAGGNAQPFMTALGAALGPWALRRHHVVKTVERMQLEGVAAPKAAAAANADLAVWLEIQSVTFELGAVPMGRARVRLRISDRSKVVFDRIIVTDTVVGDRNLAPDKLADRVAREVLTIADPHVRKRISAWR